MHDSTIDCIVVGYHELPLQSEVQIATQMSSQSAHLYSVLTNTVESDGKRLSYLEFLNRVVTRETGQDPKLHVSAMPNLGVTYLRHFLSLAGLEIESINFFDADQDRLKNLLTTNRVTSVAITTTFYTNDIPIREVVRFIRACSPSTKVIVGGPHVSNICAYYRKEVVEYCLTMIGADYFVFDSQGEATLVQLVRALRDDASDVTSIPNLLILADGLQQTHRSPENNDLEANRIQWDKLPYHLAAPTVMMRTARSCAFKCSFCTYPVLAGNLALMGVEAVEQELLQLEHLGTRNISFIDDTFNVPLGRFKAMCRMMIKNRFSFKWFSYLRCGNIDSEGLDLLAESGCGGVFLGIESGDATVLQNMNKKADAAQYRNGIIGLRERGVPSYASIIVGFPGETRDSVDRTIELLEQTRPTFFHPELYCHYQFAPVGARAAEFNLQGTGYGWSHETMDWRQAQQCLVDMISTVSKSSTYLPTYSFDFWALPYLYGRELSFDFVQSFLLICSRMMMKGLANDKGNSLAEEVELASLVRDFWPNRDDPPGSVLSLNQTSLS